jgi:hypothetical protein
MSFPDVYTHLVVLGGDPLIALVALVRACASALGVVAAWGLWRRVVCAEPRVRK